ncbi:unnamed protein product [Rangifer tarandus platyrhynchus]|uniref:Uncharacterized protein n=2 Tax=Rangifer tarandus platyrhynchus TaxID=3082113 RepID=A0AC59ZHL6_RANTA|nr:unnamed protein product [Rangifer tarandus platyrhynchus]
MEDFGAISYIQASHTWPSGRKGLLVSQPWPRGSSPLYCPGLKEPGTSVLNSFRVSFLSSTHTRNPTCGPLCDRRPRSATDPELPPHTSLASLEALLLNAWQGSGPVGPKALPSFPFPTICADPPSCLESPDPDTISVLLPE